jgi:Holliday junction resolvase RusA-like endonuclease
MNETKRAGLSVATPEKPYALSFTLMGLPKTPNAREHWTAKARQTKAWKQKVFMACWHKRPKEPLERALIRFTRVSSVRPDHDNLVASFKACMDGLRQARVIVDDKYLNVGAPEYLWRKCKPREGKVEIEVLSV